MNELDAACPSLQLKSTLAEDGGLSYLKCKLSVFEHACQVDQAAREYRTLVSQSKRGHLSSGTHSSALAQVCVCVCVCVLCPSPSNVRFDVRFVLSPECVSTACLRAAQGLFKAQQAKIRQCSNRLDSVIDSYNRTVNELARGTLLRLRCPTELQREMVVGQELDDLFDLMGSLPLNGDEVNLAQSGFLTPRARRALRVLYRIRAVHQGPKCAVDDLKLLVDALTDQRELLQEYHAQVFAAFKVLSPRDAEQYPLWRKLGGISSHLHAQIQELDTRYTDAAERWRTTMVIAQRFYLHHPQPLEF